MQPVIFKGLVSSRHDCVWRQWSDSAMIHESLLVEASESKSLIGQIFTQPMKAN